MDISPVDDTFISASLDDTVRVWDLRTPDCQGLTNVSGKPIVAFDPAGLIFAIGLNSSSIRLYDLRNFDKGPFAIIPGLDQKPFFKKGIEWKSMSFSNNGSDLLVTTMSENIYVIDSLEGNLRYTLTDFENPSRLPLMSDFTPDGNHIISGSESGQIHIWNASSGSKVCELGRHSGPVGVVKYNPKYNMMVSGCVNIAFWIPWTKL